MSGPSPTSSATPTTPASSAEPASWGRRALAVVQAGLTVGELLAGPVSEDDAAAFLERSRDRARRSAAGLSLLTAACALAWWPFDPWIYEPVGLTTLAPAIWRTVLILLPGATAALLLSTRASLAVFGAGLLGSCFALGYTASMMGGIGTPWFHILNVAFFIPVPIPVTMRQRAALTALVGVGLWLGVLLGPTAVDAGWLPMSIAVQANMVLLNLVFGNGLYLLNRQAFLQGRIIARDAARLEAYNTALEGRVAERTAELRGILATVEAARESERSRVSHELHDELGQELTVLGYEAAVLQRRYAADPTGIADQIEDLGVQLERARSALRTLVTDLRPRVLDDLGLVAALEWLTTRAADRSGIEVILHVEGDGDRIAPELALEAFRIVQEALTNALRHASARRVEVVVEVADQLSLRVVDDGVGLPASPKAGVGLLGMRERAVRVGGTLVVGSGPGGGTCVAANLPLTRTSERSPPPGSSDR